MLIGSDRLTTGHIGAITRRASTPRALGDATTDGVIVLFGTVFRAVEKLLQVIWRCTISQLAGASMEKKEAPFLEGFAKTRLR